METKNATHWALYHYVGCPFCWMVTRLIEQEDYPVELRSIHQSAEYRDELIAGGGRQTVPCLRIELDDGSVQWMYESADISAYLSHQFNSK